MFAEWMALATAISFLWHNNSPHRSKINVSSLGWLSSCRIVPRDIRPARATFCSTWMTRLNKTDLWTPAWIVLFVSSRQTWSILSSLWQWEGFKIWYSSLEPSDKGLIWTWLICCTFCSAGLRMRALIHSHASSHGHCLLISGAQVARLVHNLKLCGPEKWSRNHTRLICVQST